MKLEYDPAVAVEHLSHKDRRLGRLIATVGNFAPDMRVNGTPFEELTRSIVYQQLSGASAGAIHARLLAHGPGRRHPSPDELLDLSDTELREVGLSRSKTVALRDLARRAADGSLPGAAAMRQMADEEISEHVCEVRGVGPWTVQMMLIFRLGRPDVMPATDLGIRKGFMLTYGGDDLPSPTAIVKHAERWRPYRSVASWYLWQATYL